MANERTGAGLVSFKRIIMTSFNKSTFTRLRATFAHRYEPEYARAFADLYWRSLLVLACIIIAGVCAYSAIVFFGAIPQSSSSTASAISTISGGSNFNRVRLNATLNGFAARRTTFKDMQTGTIPPMPDPSQ